MADHPVEAEEQIDLDGDNDIEDMMDDDDPTEDDGYRRTSDEYAEQEDGGYRRTRDEYSEQETDGYRRTRHESTEQKQEQKQGSENEEHVHDNVSLSAVVIDASSSLKEEEKPVPKDEGDNEEWAELLSLPPHGSEVFIGGLPRDATEEELRDLCEPFGEISEARLVKDKDKRESKGFAFVTFTTKDAAQKAIEEIQDKEFRGKTLRCSLSQTKHRLFIGNVPKSLTEEELRKILEGSGPGVENIECFKDSQNPSRNRGFLFVEYYNHACADYARKKMSSANFKMDGSTPTISWVDPKNSADSSAASQVKAVYVKNLPENVVSEKLKELFERHGEVTKVVLPPSKAGQNKRDFGFIHFAERSSALKAVKETEKYEIDAFLEIFVEVKSSTALQSSCQVIEAVLAKPQTDKKSDHTSSNKSGHSPNYPQYPSYGYAGDPYGSYGSAGRGQPMIYGRGPMPAGMRMVPMVLPDGRVGYVLQQAGAQASHPPPSRRSDRGGGSSDGGDKDRDRHRGRRYRPY
ncbi:heterogeneous nuclear ribonucleoprotein R [Iris pallida]|uniref:Heterogeneous nuclear ribonucleoprotein R n=1 Tax=Iris pallida TaxID=29817 RepID=A0AAX6G067_IRIPA|nr:heterogeneous nuclear ribonucleoprotein R [Iris pallida]